MNPADTFRALHHDRPPGDPLVLPGPWDAVSARVFAEAGFPALSTPSAGIAASLGYADGETPAGEMFAAVARIVRAVDVPVSADLENGYGLAPRELVERLLETGAVGCNLEDSDAGVLLDPHRHADRIAEVRAAAGDRLFVNARVDSFAHGDGDPERAVERAALYVAAGADCVYPIGAPPTYCRYCGLRSPDRSTRSPGWTARAPPPANSARSGPPASRSGRGCSAVRRRTSGNSPHG
ncbi:Carboxyvinyl-carboxyphosphonate phosphorylmutase [Streptomyces sp. MBT84]|nr:Carboxyvinyl-carboxyphosphonate phosphorylmutase [Streptomyces sp. MBT84]